MVADQDNLSKPLFRKVELSIEESQRIYDSNGFLLRAATVCVKDSSESEVNYFKVNAINTSSFKSFFVAMNLSVVIDNYLHVRYGISWLNE